MQYPNGVQVVWFKRDLRATDHRPLVEAALRGPSVCLYVYEPEVLQGEDFDASHLTFINEALTSLAAALSELGVTLTTRIGSMPGVLDELNHEFGVAHLWSHEETGNAVTYARDLKVKAWAQNNCVPWTEFQDRGVVRKLGSRDGWSRLWLAHVNQPIEPLPDYITPVMGIDSQTLRGHEELGLAPSTRTSVQVGGREQGLKTLRSFLRERGVNYRKDMSSPGGGWTGCSRVSPYIAWGCLSIREVHQLTERRRQSIVSGAKPDLDPRWRASLNAYSQRLRWHCHFIQKLEDEPDIEFNNMNRAFDGLREEQFDDALFDAWCHGMTGYPMVDACMRALRCSGWINFRMRAMLVSFAAYHLWLHWRRPAQELARLFLDYEPGIHYSQIQMQSGVTGINAIRIYSPAKQVLDNDPEGTFIKRYCPELLHVPAEYLAEPHTMPHAVQLSAGCVIGVDYPAPVVNHAEAYREARTRIYSVRGQKAVRDASRQVYAKHGSRRRPPRRRTRRAG